MALALMEASVSVQPCTVAELLKSYLGAHVLHSRQRQLSQVSVLHPRAHQWHGDVPDGLQSFKKESEAMLNTSCLC